MLHGDIMLYTRVSCLSGGSRWCLLAMIVESPIQFIDLISYCICVLLLYYM